MNKSIIYLICTAAALTPFTRVYAAEVEVKWSNSDKYSDIDAGNGLKKQFQERTFKSFEKHFAKLAKLLPENQKLVLNITNVDLAGDVNYGGIDRVRVVKDIYFPRLKFSYQLLSANNTEIKAADVSLKDMGFLTHSRLKYRSKPLSYEKGMVDKWFKNTFIDEIAK